MDFGETYPLLGELTGALVLGVAQQLNDAALVGGEAGVQWLALVKTGLVWRCEARAEGQRQDIVLTPLLPVHHTQNVDLPRDLTDNIANEGSALADLALHGRDAGLGDAGGGLLLIGKTRRTGQLLQYVIDGSIVCTSR